MTEANDPKDMDKLTQQFVVGDRVRVTATGQTGTIAHVISKNISATGEPAKEPQIFTYDIVLDEDGSMTTLYEGIERLAGGEEIEDVELGEEEDEDLEA